MPVEDTVAALQAVDMPPPSNVELGCELLAPADEIVEEAQGMGLNPQG